MVFHIGHISFSTNSTNVTKPYFNQMYFRNKYVEYLAFDCFFVFHIFMISANRLVAFTKTLMCQMFKLYSFVLNYILNENSST